MTQSLALFPRKLSSAQNKLLLQGALILTGAGLLTALAQVSIPLPWTPVRITGQTFGVALMALLWGRRLGFFSFLTYIAFGTLGLPVFSMGKTLFELGPTLGYVFGMAVGANVIGYLADIGWSRNFKSAFFAACLGSLCTFIFGLIVLSYFVPTSQLLWAGLIPFLPGDIIKNGMAAFIAARASGK